MTRIKICGITRPEDARAAASLGADAVGLMFYPRSARYVALGEARALAAALPPFVCCVGVFVNAEAAEVRAAMEAVPLDLLQFHGEESPEFCAQFGRPWIRAVQVRPGVDLLQYAARFRGAKALLLDAYLQGSHGGTGTVFDWSLIPPSLPVPIVLSGGLSADNVERAIARVRPWAVDVSSGVEAAKGVKDPKKMAAFIQGVRNADLRSSR